VQLDDWADVGTTRAVREVVLSRRVLAADVLGVQFDRHGAAQHSDGNDEITVVVDTHHDAADALQRPFGDHDRLARNEGGEWDEGEAAGNRLLEPSYLLVVDPCGRPAEATMRVTPGVEMIVPVAFSE
jgi:hypothetical protein